MVRAYIRKAMLALAMVPVAFLTVLVLATVPASAADGQSEALDGRFIDLTVELPADAASVGAWARRHGDDLYPVGGASETPGPALLGTIRAGALVLTRSRASGEPSGKIYRVADDVPLADTAVLSLGTSAGLDITLLTALSQISELEVRFFGIDGWSTSRTAGDPQGVWFEGFGAVLTPAQSERIDYGSRLYNVELNLRPRVADGMPLILGFRSLQLHERLALWTLDPPPTVDIDMHTNNYLYGVQVGAEPYLLGDSTSPLRLEGLAKAGIYGNCASQGTCSTLLGRTLTAKHTRSSFVGEVGLMIDYRFSRFFAARAGYELLWVSGVALAPDQSASTDLLGPLAGVNTSATAFYQGAAVSLEFVF
jgi:hypothetical protein